MKALLVNLLIVLALALCGLNAYQWYREAGLRGRLDDLGGQLFNKSAEIQELQQSLDGTRQEIQRLEGIRDNFESLIRSNRLAVIALEEEIGRLRTEAQAQASRVSQLEPYRQAFEQANENLKKQNSIIQDQNDKMRQLAEERNDVVTRFNKLAADYKSLSADYTKVLGMYTNLVAEVQASQRGSR